MSNTTGIGHANRFPNTRWSLVLEARDDKRAQVALEELCQIYWRPLYAFIRQSGFKREDAEDFCQEFLVRVVERRQFDSANPEHGKLRSYLLAYLKHFLSDKRRIAGAKKRGGGRELVSIDHLEAEARYLSELSHEDTPQKAFEKTWTLTLLDVVLSNLGEDYQSDGKGELFEALRPTLQWGGSAEDLKSIADQLGMREGAIKVAAHRLRKRYRVALRAHVEATLAEGENIEDEIRALFDLLSQ